MKIVLYMLPFVWSQMLTKLFYFTIFSSSGPTQPTQTAQPALIQIIYIVSQRAANMWSYGGH